MKRKEVKKVQKKKNFKRRFFISFIILFAVLLSIGGYIYFQAYQATSDSYSELNRDKSLLREKSVDIGNDPISILLLGIENYSSGGSNGRSDTIIVLTFNQDEETLKMLSIPRDTFVPIIGENIQDKINHSYAYGGAEMTINTVEEFLNIPIDYFATIDFAGFLNVIDIVGGITVDVPFNFSEDSHDGTGKLYYTEGAMDLNGKQALGYARMRKQDPEGDIGRGDRQKQVVEAVIDKLTSPSTVFKIDNLANEYGENVTSNLKLSELMSFYKEYRNFNTNNIEQLKLDGTNESIDGISYYVVDEKSLETISTELRSHLELN
ncbi:LytR family transcriptional regulator [Aquibacillus halophilus]|uniref:LytR family transcriptional regulator n=1 Tax=Aquibacillus halophilus TaxID=930132 RepID=A0A6A8DHG3_9BACI|nr:LCP family protein [Aquibacillus halophilus]MRH43936.1 LytR family transcriptional regulator [Aquibacillus halophilus]